MNPFHDHLHTRSRDISLSDAERARMRRVVGGYMRLHPARARGARASSFSFFSTLFSRHAMAFVLVGAVLTSSAGVSYAAESALPGDALYPVKTRVNEPLRGALASSPVQKAEWAMHIADERAKEAATLAAQEKLDDNTRETIAENFREHATLAAASIEEAAADDPLESAQRATRFEARLSEYERVIVALANPSDTDDSIARTIRTEREAVAKVRARAEERIDDVGDDSYRRAAEASLAHAQEHIRAARTAFASSTEEIVVAQLEAASSTMAARSEDASRDELRASARKTLRDAEKLRAFAETSKAIHARTGFVIERDEVRRASATRTAARSEKSAIPATDPARTSTAATSPGEAALMMAMPAPTEAPAAADTTSEPAGEERNDRQDERSDTAGERTKRSGSRERGAILIPVPDLDEDEQDDD